MKVLIIEDEKAASDRMQRLLKTIDNEIEIITVIDTVEEAINWFANNLHPDLVFMDIQLLDGLSFEIFTEVDVKAPVIFATSFNNYAIQAFKVNGIDYILKPVDIEELKKSLNKFKLLKSTFIKNDEKQVEALYKSMNINTSNYKNRFLLKRGQSYVSLAADDIYCFYIENQLVSLISKNKELYSVDYTLDELEQMLNPEMFFRANRQCILNIKAIATVHNYFNSKLKVLLNIPFENEIIISREKSSAFKNWLDS